MRGKQGKKTLRKRACAITIPNLMFKHRMAFREGFFLQESTCGDPRLLSHQVNNAVGKQGYRNADRHQGDQKRFV